MNESIFNAACDSVRSGHVRRAQAWCKESTLLFGPDWYGLLTEIQARSNYLLEEITECAIKATASLRRKRNHVPRRNDEVVVIQVFFLESIRQFTILGLSSKCATGCANTKTVLENSQQGDLE